MEEKNLKTEIDEEIKKKLEEKIKQKVDQKVEEKLQTDKNIDKEIDSEVNQLIQDEIILEDLEPIKKPILGIRKAIAICWKGACRYITWVMIISYLISAILIGVCAINLGGICSQGIISSAPYSLFIVLISGVISILLSIYSSYTRTAFLYWLVLNIPFFILLIIFTAKYIGLFLIGIIFVLWLTQRTRGY